MKSLRIKERDKGLSDNDADEDDDVKVPMVATKGKESSGIIGKKRKRNKGEIIEEVITKAMKTVTDGMKESEKMFLEMEERQMEFQERMRQKDQEFHMRMMQMMMTGCSPQSSSQLTPYHHPFPPPSQPEFYNNNL